MKNTFFYLFLLIAIFACSKENITADPIIGEWQFDVGMLDKAEFFEMSEQVYEDLERAGSLDKEHFTLSIKTKLIERGYVV